MKISIIAVGKAGRSAETELGQRYLSRLRWPVNVVEVEERRPISGPERQKSEAAKLLKAVPPGASIVALDEIGKSMASEAFASYLDRKNSQGINEFAFIIGGADGLTDEIRSRADLLLSLGAMTWPHLLARTMLIEQIYRASTILDGHPYHRS